MLASEPSAPEKNCVATGTNIRRVTPADDGTMTALGRLLKSRAMSSDHDSAARSDKYLSVCDVRGCSNLVESSKLVHFPPISRVHDRVRWWTALYGRLNFRLSVKSAPLTAVCYRHFSKPSDPSAGPDLHLPNAKEAVTPVPTELVRDKPSNLDPRATLRTYSRKSGDDAPGRRTVTVAKAAARYKPIAPAAPPPLSATMVMPALPPPQPQFRLLQAGGVQPSSTFQVVPSRPAPQLSLGTPGSSVIQLVQQPSQLQQPPSQFQLVTTAATVTVPPPPAPVASPYRLISANTTGPLLAPAPPRCQAATNPQYQLMPASGAQLVLMPPQRRTVTPVSSIQPSLPLVVVNSSTQRSSSSQQPPLRQLQPALPIARLARPRQQRRGRGESCVGLMVSGRGAGVARSGSGPGQEIQTAAPIPLPTSAVVPGDDGDNDMDDDVEVIDVAFGLPDADGAAKKPKQEVFDVTGDESDVAEDDPEPTQAEAGDTDPAEPVEQDLGGLQPKQEPDLCKSEGDTVLEHGQTECDGRLAAADSGRVIKQEPASQRPLQPPDAAPSMIRLKPLSELTTAAGAQQTEAAPAPPPPRVLTPPGISLDSAGELSEADLMLQSMQRREKRARIEAEDQRAADESAQPEETPAKRARAADDHVGQRVQIPHGSSAYRISERPTAGPSSHSPKSTWSERRPSSGPRSTRRTPLEIVRRTVSASRAVWQERGAHARHRADDLKLGSLLDVLLSKTLRSSLHAISTSMGASSNRDTVVGLINHFILVEKLGMEPAWRSAGSPSRSKARRSNDGSPSSARWPNPSLFGTKSLRPDIAPQTDGAPSFDADEAADAPRDGRANAIPEQMKSTVEGFSLPVGLSIMPLADAAQSGDDEAQAGNSEVTITPVAPPDEALMEHLPLDTECFTQLDRRRCVRLVTCRLCGAAGFPSWIRLHHHMQHFHRERSVLFAGLAICNPGLFVVCIQCPAVTPTSADSIRHVEEAHPEQWRQLATGMAKIRCDSCLKVVGRTGESASEHNTRCVHAGPDGSSLTFQCVTCGTALKHLMEVYQHEDNHGGGLHGYRSRCQLCAFSGSVVACRRHVRTVHSQDCYLLGCALCDNYGTDTWTDAEQHVQCTHSPDAKPTLLQCPLCCLRLVGGEAKMKQHIRLHRSHKVVAAPETWSRAHSRRSAGRPSHPVSDATSAGTEGHGVASDASSDESESADECGGGPAATEDDCDGGAKSVVRDGDPVELCGIKRESKLTVAGGRSLSVPWYGDVDSPDDDWQVDSLPPATSSQWRPLPTDWRGRPDPKLAMHAVVRLRRL